MLRAACKEAMEDHLGAGLIRHGDTVIIKGSRKSVMLFKKGGTASNRPFVTRW